MSYPLYNIMTYDPIDTGWEDDSFASGWTAYQCTRTRDGDIVKLKTDLGYAEGWFQKSSLSIDAATYKYCIVCVKGDDKFFVEVHDGSWKSVTVEAAPSEYDVKVYDLSGVTTGTITRVRLGVGDALQKEAYYDFVAFCSYQPQFTTDRILSLQARQTDVDTDDFEILGTHDIGGGLTIGRRVRIWLNGVGGIGQKARKVFAGTIEESTPDDAAGRCLKITGRDFGQEILLRSKSKNFSMREVSLAVKDFVEDITEITTWGVETPSPTVNITKDYRYTYILDGVKDLAKWVGSDWEVKLGMGHDLRFRSRTSDYTPSLPFSITESNGHILRNVSKETDGYRAYNKVTVLGGEMSNFNNDPDEYTDQGDISTYVWQIFGGGGSSTIVEDGQDYACGTCSMKSIFTGYSNSLTTEFRPDPDGVDATIFTHIRFMHQSTGIAISPPETTFYLRLRLVDTGGKHADRTYLSNNAQPPAKFAEVSLRLDEFSADSGFDWQHVRYVQFQCVSDRTNPDEGVGGYYWVDKVFFYTSNITKSVTATGTDFRHTREYIYRDEKLVDPDFIQEVADALLNVLKNKENRFRLPLVGIPTVQVGHKATVNSPTWELNGTYYVVEAVHRVTPSQGYVTEMVLESPRLYFERLLSDVIESKIKLLERGGLS